MKMMKYLALVFLFPFTISACSTNFNLPELIAYASVVSQGKAGSEFEAIGIYVPTSIEKAKAHSMNIQYLNEDTLLLETSIEVRIANDVDAKLNPRLQPGYSASYFHLNMSQVDNISIIVNYQLPRTKDGGITICEPFRRYKLVDLIAQKPKKPIKRD